MSNDGDVHVPWAVRQPEGYYDAVQATGTTVAPILAGFAFAIMVLVLVPPAKDEADPLRWRDPVLALLVFSALLLIISTQAAIRARATLVKPDELGAWYPSSIDTGWPNEWLGERQKELEERTARSSSVCRHTYNAGVLLFFTAIAVLLVPLSPVDDTRRAVLVAATIAVAVEAAWLTGTSLRQNRWFDRLPTVLTPAGYAVGAVVILCLNQTGASRAVAAASMAVAGAAALASAIRLMLKGTGCCSRQIGIVMLFSIFGAWSAAALLLADWKHAASLTSIMTGALVLLLTAAVIPGGRVQGPDDG
jgi:hypothetical protein